MPVAASFTSVTSADVDEWESLLAGQAEEKRAAIVTQAIATFSGEKLDQAERGLRLLQLFLANAAWDYPESIQTSLLAALAHFFYQNLPRHLTLLALRVAQLALARKPDSGADSIAVFVDALGYLVTSNDSSEARLAAQQVLQHEPSFAAYRNAKSRSAYHGSRPVTLEVDFTAALQTCRLDIVGDWYKDPWQWTEIDFLATPRGNQLLRERLNSAYTAPAVKIDVAKNQHSSRPALVLDVIDRVCYEAIVDAQVRDRLTAMPDWVFGWRPARLSGILSPSRYAENGIEWRRYIQTLREYCEAFPYVLRADVAQFFSSINVSNLLDNIRPVAKHPRMIERLESFLLAWETIPRRSGLPQRCNASSLLAQIVLGRCDDFLSRRCVAPSMAVCRWMDDIWVFARSEHELVRVREELDGILELDGLELNASKSSIMDTSESLVEQYAANAYAVERELSDPATHEAPSVDDLLQKLLLDPDQAPRAMIRLATRTIRKVHKIKTEWASEKTIESFPQGAEHFARALRDTGGWKQFETWYVRTATRRLSAEDWTIQAWGLMFPAAHGDRSRVAKYFFDEVLQRSLPTLLVPLAATRSTQWTGEGLDALRVAGSLTRQPFEARAIAIASTAARAEAREVKEWLTQYPSLIVTYETLQWRAFATPSLGPDFKAAPAQRKASRSKQS